MPDDMIQILGFGRKSLDFVKLVTVIPVANVFSHFLCQVHIKRPQEISSEFYCDEAELNRITN
jgi:hypothetical protein